MFDRVRYVQPPVGLIWSDDDARRQITWELIRGYQPQTTVVWVERAGLAVLDDRERVADWSQPVATLSVSASANARPHWVRLARPMVRPAVKSSVLTLGSVAVALLYPWPLKVAVDAVDGTGWMGVTDPAAIAAAMAAASLVLVLIGAAFDYGSTLISARAAERSGAQMRAMVLRRLLHMPMSFFDVYSSGELLARLNGDIDRVHDGMVRVVTSVLPEAATLLGMAVVLLAVDPLLGLVGLAAAPLLALITYLKRRPTDRLQRESRRRQGELQSTASDTLRNARAIQGLGAEPWAMARYDERAASAVAASIKSTEFSARMSPIADLLLAVISALVLWIGVIRVSSGHLSVGSLLVVFSYLGGLYSPVRELARVGQVVSRTAASRDRLAEILTHPLPSERLLTDGTAEQPGIVLDAVSFAYPSGLEVLGDVSLRIGAREHVCIVGPSGVGKTTLLHLLVRLYEPTAGTIAVDGIDVHDRSMEWLRSKVALVPQDCWILDTTLRENLMLDTPDLTDAAMRSALELAMLDDLVERMPDGLDTRLGEGGSRLSGGERRRVALARALLRGADVVLLDEPTSGLDPVSERRIAESLRGVARERTVLTVTHSPVVAATADRVFRLDHGRLVPIGAVASTTHQPSEVASELAS